MKFRYVLLTFFALCGVFSAQAQSLVIYDARDLFPKDAWSPACKAVFTEEYYYSQEWQDLNDRINTYLLYQEAKDNPDWIPLADDEFRQKVETGKKATDIKLDYARIEMGDGPDEHRLIVRIPGEGFTVMDEYCNIITTKRYDELMFAKFYGWLPDALYWARKGKTYYLIDILTGQEKGTFTFSRRDKENIFFDVKITYFGS